MHKAVPMSCPDSIDRPIKTLFDEGLRQENSGLFSEAIDSYKESILACSDNIDFAVAANFNIAICYGELGRLESAEASIREVLNLNPFCKRALEYLREICLSQGRNEESEAITSLILRI